MRTLEAILLLLVPAVLACGGCSAPAQPTQPTVTRVTAETPEAYEQLWEATTATLRSYCLQVDRQDHASGIITTFPDTTANWFEFWRPQPESAYYWAEANTKTMQRQAAVNIRPTGDPGAYDLDVRIDRLEYSLPERQIDNSAAAMRLFSSAAPTEAGRMERPSQSSHWIQMGRDDFMERAVLTAILKRYGKSTGKTQPAEFGQP